MRQKSGQSEESAEKVVKDIRRATRRQFSVEEKIRFVLAGLRGDGGLVAAPPSRHPSGRRYAWAEGCAPDTVALAPMPDWLLRLASVPPGGPGHPLRHWRALIERGVGEGERNNTIASLAGYLFWHELDTQVVLDLLLCWNAARCRPPLPAEEVARTVESIARLHAQGRDDDGEP